MCLLQTILYVPIVYWMLGFDNALDKFIYFLIMFFGTLTLYTFFGQMVVYVTPSQPVAHVFGARKYAYLDPAVNVLPFVIQAVSG